MSKHYMKLLNETKQNIIELLSSLNVSFINIKNRFRINCGDKSYASEISHQIDNIIEMCFTIMQPIKIRKYNYYNGILYIKFKRRV